MLKLIKKQRNALIVFVVSAIIITTLVVFVQFYGFSMVVDDGGGGDIIPPDEPTLPEPPLDLEPLPDINPPNEPILNMIASPSITGEIHIIWSTVSDADDYAVYRSDDGTSYDYLGKVYANSYDDLLIDDGTYFYKIKAGNEGGLSDFSNIKSVIVKIPRVPNSPEAHKITYKIIDSKIEISVSWSEIDCDSYNLYREIITDDMGTTGFVLIEEGLILTSYSEVLTKDGKYTYKVSGVNMVGESELSNPTTIRITGSGVEIVESLDNDYMWLYVLVGVFSVSAVLILILIKKKNK